MANVERLDAAGPGLQRPIAAASGAFTRFALEYAAQHQDRKIMVLQAGCATAGTELDLAALRSAVTDLGVYLVDDDVPAVRSVVSARPDLGSATLGELRSVSMPPRSFDIVHCAMLLERIKNAELVLGRLVAALRPGGLLLLSTADRQTAAGFLNRRMPGFLRSAIWRAGTPGQPGPFPAIYEPIVSASGLQAFLTRHGLSVAHRQACTTGDGGDAVAAVRAALGLVTWLSRGRLSGGYDELRYVVRKPEDSFARVLH